MEAREKRAHVENNGTCGENEKAYSVKSSDELGQLVPVEARPDHVDMNQISIRISTVVQRHSFILGRRFTGIECGCTHAYAK